MTIGFLLLLRANTRTPTGREHQVLKVLKIFFPFNKGHLLYPAAFLCGKTKIDSAHTDLLYMSLE